MGFVWRRTTEAAKHNILAAATEVPSQLYADDAHRQICRRLIRGESYCTVDSFRRVPFDTS